MGGQKVRGESGGGMAGGGAAAGQAGPQTLGASGGAGPRAGSDWAGLPEHLLMKVAETLVAQNEAGWAVRVKEERFPDSPQSGWTEEDIREMMARRKRKGNCLYIFARVCKGWRKAQVKVGGPLRTRVCSDVILPGRVELVNWALAEGCPGDDEGGDLHGYTMAHFAARYGHLELVRWLCGEGGFAMDEGVMADAAGGGNLELVQWMRGEGCPWDTVTCYYAIDYGHVEVLRWARENGCPWDADTRDWAASELGYTDNLGNLVDIWGNPVLSDDDEDSDEEYSDEE